MYAADNRGRYPASLKQLLPGSYLMRLPRCPAVGCHTYSSSYTWSTHPAGYTFHCRGNHHQGSACGTFASAGHQGVLIGQNSLKAKAVDGGFHVQKWLLVLIALQDVGMVERVPEGGFPASGTGS